MEKGRVGIIGATPQDLSDLSAGDKLRQLFAADGKKAVCYGMGDGLDAVKQAASAEYNLVVSPSALETAKYLQKQFGTPYVVGYPLVRTMLPELDYTGKKVLIVHQQVLANALREELKVRGASEVKVCSWFDMKSELLEEGDVYLKEEDDFTELAAGSQWDVIIADNCMTAMLPKFEGQFVWIRHFAVSGKLMQWKAGPAE